MKVLNIEWTIRFPFIEAYCADCKSKFLIEFVSINTHIKHCGVMRTRLPEKVWESYCDVKEMKKTGRPQHPDPDAAPRDLGQEQSYANLNKQNKVRFL